eukprot:gene14474-biopygen23524
MVKNPQLVYEKAEEAAAAFRAKVEVSPILKWIKDVSKDLEVMRATNLDLPLSERNHRAKNFILNQLSTDYQAVYCHFATPDNIISSLKDEYSGFYFSQDRKDSQAQIDAVVLGNYEEDVPVESDDDMVPAPVTTPSEIKEMDLFNERAVRLQANPPLWGSPSEFSFSPSIVYQPSIMPDTSSPTHNDTVEQGDEHNPPQQPLVDPTSPAPMQNQETVITDIPAILEVLVHEINKDRQPGILSTKNLEFHPGDIVKNPQLVYEKAEEAVATFRAKAEAEAKAEARKHERKKARGEVDPNLRVHDLRSGVVQDVQGGKVWVDIGAGVIGKLEKHQISQECVTGEDVKKMFSVGDDIKVIVCTISEDGKQITLSTKSLEVNPGDMDKNPQLVYEKAEKAAAAFRTKAREQERMEARGVVDPNLEDSQGKEGLANIHILGNVIEATNMSTTLDLGLSKMSHGEVRGEVWVDIGAGFIGRLENLHISQECITGKDVKKMFSVGDKIKVTN